MFQGATRTAIAWLATTLISIVAAAAFAANPTPHLDTDRIVVRLKGGDPSRSVGVAQRDSIAARLSTRGGEAMRHLRIMGDGSSVMQLTRRLPAAALEQLIRRIGTDEDVIEVLPDRIAFSTLTPNDPQFATQWALSLAQGVNAPGAWDVTTGSPNLIIGIIDTGKLDHADLAGRWIGGYDFVDATRSNDGDGRDADPHDPGDWVTNVSEGCATGNSSWHGTAMAGIIAATGNNGAGIAGMNWSSKILPVRAVGKCGGYASDVVDGMRWAAGIPISGVPGNPNTADVVNLSIATPGDCDTTWQSAINELNSAGIPIIVAAGNNGASASGFSPGNCTGVITVGAVDRNGGRPTYSNSGIEVTLSAPGGTDAGANGVLTTFDSGTTVPANDNAYASQSGTSVAAAHVTGVASLMLSVRPTLSVVGLRTLMTETARGFPDAVALGSPQNCNPSLCGKGIVNAQGATQAAKQFPAASPQVVPNGPGATGLRSDGAVFSWLTSLSNGYWPELRNDISDVVKLAGGAANTFALRADSTIWGWGYLQNPQGPLSLLANGEFNGSVYTAAPVAGLSGVTDIASGQAHGLALRADGSISAWGWNSSGQLGDGTTNNGMVLVQVQGLAGVTSVAAGATHSLALKSDRTVWAWGSNGDGQLGDGTTTQRLTPVQVSGLSNVIALASSFAGLHSLALKGDGTVWAWGSNSAGQLGDNTTINRNLPVQVPGLTNVVAIAATPRHSVALKEDGTVWVWGDAGAYADGDTTTQRLMPMQVPGLSSIQSLGGGIVYGNTPLLWAVYRDGGVTRWGPDAPQLAVGPGNVGTWNLDLAAMAFTPQVNVPPSTVVQSNFILLSGIPNGSAISVTGGEYRIDSGSFTNSPGTINSGQMVTLRQLSGPCNTTTIATVTIAGVPRSFSVATVACDLVPDPFTFGIQANVPLNSARISNAVTIWGINGATPISVVGGEYSIGCTATFTAAAGTIDDGQAVCVRQISSANYDTITLATLTVGTVSGVFRTLTVPAPGFAANPQVVSGGPSNVNGNSTVELALRSDGSIFEWNWFYDTPARRNDISGVVKLAAAYRYAVALRGDGTVWAWGSFFWPATGIVPPILADGGASGQNSSAAPAPVVGLSSVTDIAAGATYVLALRSDKTVWSWGRNDYGQLGNGTTTDASTVVPVQGLNNVTSVASGSFHSLALKADQTVVAWGLNSSGQLGDGTTTQRTAPVPVPGLASVIAIASAGNSRHSLALKGDQTVWAWGDNQFGQLGDNTTVNRSVPVQVQGLANIVAVAAGPRNSFALRNDGTVWAWGAAGVYGDGDEATSRLTPVQVSGLSSIAAIGATIEVDGARYFAIRADGGVMTWYAGAPQLVVGPGGVGTLNLNPAGGLFTPQVDVALSTVIVSNEIVINGIANGSAIGVTGGDYQIDSGTFTNLAGTINSGQSVRLRQASASQCGTTTTATVTVAGVPRNFNVTTTPCDTTPNPFSFATQANVSLGSLRTSNTVTIGGVNGPTPISVAGGEYSIGCTASFASTAGTITNGQTVCVRQAASASYDAVTTATLTLGTASVPFRVITAPAPGFVATPQAFSGGYSSVITQGVHQPVLGLRSDGMVFQWVRLQWYTFPEPPGGLEPILRTDISGVVKLAGSWWHTLALRGGTVWTWGYFKNAPDTSVLPNGTPDSVIAAPTPVSGLSSVVDIAAGDSFSLAARADGSVWGWGRNHVGQLGNGATTNAATFVQVQGLSGATAVAAGESHSLALRSDLTVWAWGNNVDGRLGDGTTTNRSTPVQVSGLTNVIAIAASPMGYHSLALKDDHTVWAWGDNQYGQLGDNSRTNRSLPVQAQGLTNVVAIATGPRHSLALRNDGTVWAWGYRGVYGDDNTTTDHLTPVQVPGLSSIQGIGAGIGSGDLSYFWAIRSDGGVMYWSWEAPQVLNGPGGAGTLNLNLAAGLFTPRTNFPFSTGVESNPIIVSGIPDGSSISVTGGEYRIDAGSYTNLPGTINNGQSVTVRQTSSNLCSTTTTVTVTIAGVARSFSVTTMPCGGAPTPFSFPSQANVPLGSVRTGRTGAIYGITGQAPISIVGGTYSINCSGSYTDSPGMMNDNSIVCVQLAASNNYDTTTTATLTIGGLSASFRVITQVAPGFAVAPNVIRRGFSSAALRSDGAIMEWNRAIWGSFGLASVQVEGISGVIKIAGNDTYSYGLRSDGTLWAWAGSVTWHFPPTNQFAFDGSFFPLSGLSGVVDFSIASTYGLAIKAGGTVWGWGSDLLGEAGHGTLIDASSAVQVQGLSGATALAAGAGKAIVLKADQTVCALSWDANSQLTCVAVPGLGNVIAVSASPGGGHFLALKGDRTVWSWGSNASGQLGDNSMVDRPTPVPVPGLGSVVAIGTAPANSFALKEDGTVWAWGAAGAYGDGDNTTVHLAPLHIQGLSSVQVIGAYSAVRNDGSVPTWKDQYWLSTPAWLMVGPDGGPLNLIVQSTIPNAFAFLPSFGAALSSPAISNPITVTGLGVGTASPIAISGGLYSINFGAYTSASSAVVNGDVVRVQVQSAGTYETLSTATVTIGPRSGNFNVYTRRDPARPPAIPEVSLGEFHSILLNAQGNVFGFGYNGNGQLGNGTTFSTPSPSAASGVARITNIASGSNHVLALKDDGSVLAWGHNAVGQLGSGASSLQSENAVSVSGLAFVKAISAGKYHSLALKADGTVWAWGLNTQGQVGTGSPTNIYSTPVQVLSGISAISAGGRHNLALSTSGALYGWGANANGQLGDGSTTNRTTPTILPINGVAGIAACGEHSLILKNDGSVWAFGGNGFGQLGNGTTTNSNVPVPVTGMQTNVGLIACGENHSLAVKSGGALYAWGANGNGQLGDGTNIPRSTAIQVATPTQVVTQVVAIAGGGHHSAAIKNNGELYVWGDNFFGQIGNRTGNFNPLAASLNVLRGDSLISGLAAAQASSIGTLSFGGSSVIVIEGVATGYDFQAVTTNTTSSVTGEFGNQSSTIVITGVSVNVSGAGFSLGPNECIGNVASNGKCGFTIQFTPPGPGSWTGSLSIAASNLEGSLDRSLQGNGINPNAPGLRIEATGAQRYLQFVPEAIGTPTQALVKIINGGTAPLTITSATIIDGNADFSLTNACPTVAAGASCNQPVTFSPSALGERRGTLRIVSNAATDATQDVSLEGTGDATAPGAAVALVSVASRKSHAGVGLIDLPINTGQPIGGAVTVEPRSAAIHTIVFAFNGAISYTGAAAAVDGSGNPLSVSASATVSEVLVTLAGLADNKRATVTLTNVNSAGVNATASMGFLVGDVDGTRTVTASDILRVKGRQGQTAGQSNFRHGVNLDATIGPADLASVKARSGLSLP